MDGAAAGGHAGAFDCLRRAERIQTVPAVFAAAEEDRPQWLADPDNAALWEQLGLSGSVVSDGDPAALTIGAQNWVPQPATVEGKIRDPALLR